MKRAARTTVGSGSSSLQETRINMKSSPEVRKDVALVLIDIVVAVCVVLFLKWINIQLTTAQDIMVGLLLTMSFLLAEIFWIVRRMEERELEEEQLWLIEHPFGQTLHNIRLHYKDIAQRFYGDHDLFKDYFDRRLTETEEVIQAAAIHHEIEVE